MTDVLEDAGLEPAPEDTPNDAPETPEVTEPTPEPEVVVPEGAENPDAVKAAIQAERKRAREANAKARDLERQLKERDEADKPLEERLASADAKATEASLKALRYEVALEKGLSVKLASRLAGSSKQELEDDADTLVSELGVKPATPHLDGGYKQDPPKPKDPNQAHNEFIVGLLTGTQQG